MTSPAPAAPGFDAASSRPWLIAVVSSLATFMEVLDTTIVNVSLAQIAGSMGATQEESTWVLTSYLVSNAIILPLSGWLSEALGRKRYFMFSIAGFAAASFLCGASSSLTMLVFFRLLQGIAGGGLQPTQQAIILDAFPPTKRGVAFGLVGITMVVAPILGPTLGGWITDNYSWRWIFFMNIPVSIFAILSINKLIEDPPHSVARGMKRVDYVGLSLVTLAIGFLQIMLDKGEQDDWFESTFIRICAAVSLLSGIAAVRWLLKQREPVVQLGLLKDPGFGIGCLMIFVTGFSLYGGAALMPLMLQSQYGYNSTLAGLVLSPGGIAVMFLMPFIGKVSNMVPARYMVFFGMLMMAAGMWHTMGLTPQVDYGTFVWMRITQVLGLPFLFIPISTLAFMNIPPGMNNKASAFYSLFRNIGGSVGIAIAATYVQRHAQLRQWQLSRHLSPYNPVYREYLRSHAEKFGSVKAAMGGIYHELFHQSALLAYIDVYRMLMFVALATAGFALFMPHNDPKAGRAAGGGH
ncbi:MAG: DHA2 family efflux MFS transporter permease subunit [Alphaproteobacteria bacterium]|nr:DHA2 family efflux MFS transporter permease subunit [Alphaproteobacteria bacterium]